MKRIHTQRLVIRNFLADDWVALREMIVQYQASDLAQFDRPWPTAPEDVRKLTAWFAGGDDYLAVCLRATDRVIGFVALNPQPADDLRTFNLGYIFNFDFHGRGYAAEACRAVLAHAFDVGHAQRVVTGTAAANAASCRLLERLGFHKIAENAVEFGRASFLGYTFALSRDDWQTAQTFAHSSAIPC